MTLFSRGTAAEMLKAIGLLALGAGFATELYTIRLQAVMGWHTISAFDGQAQQMHAFYQSTMWAWVGVCAVGLLGWAVLESGVLTRD